MVDTVIEVPKDHEPLVFCGPSVHCNCLNLGQSIFDDLHLMDGARVYLGEREELGGGVGWGMLGELKGSK